MVEQDQSRQHALHMPSLPPGCRDVALRTVKIVGTATGIAAAVFAGLAVAIDYGRVLIQIPLVQGALAGLIVGGVLTVWPYWSEDIYDERGWLRNVALGSTGVALGAAAGLVASALLNVPAGEWIAGEAAGIAATTALFTGLTAFFAWCHERRESHIGRGLY